MKKVTLGGDRLGSGRKNQVEIEGFGRSSHDLSHVWKSTMAAGTLVPFLKQPMMPGDTFDIDLDCEVLTHPTIGPLFGSYKVQLDVFLIPVRPYNRDLQLNQVEVGLHMENIIFPWVQAVGKDPRGNPQPDNSQINPSHLLKYLGISGVGYVQESMRENQTFAGRRFNGLPYAMYFDIFYYYYANKQEEIGYIIHNDLIPINVHIDVITFRDIVRVLPENPSTSYQLTEGTTQNSLQGITMTADSYLDIDIDTGWEEFDLDLIQIWIGGSGGAYYSVKEVFQDWEWDTPTTRITGTNPFEMWLDVLGDAPMLPIGYYTFNTDVPDPNKLEPKLVEFPLNNIPEYRKRIYANLIGVENFDKDMNLSPYDLPLQWEQTEEMPYELTKSCYLNNQEGLLVKTYQSDKFQNWLNTEWLDGTDGINQVSAIQVIDDKILVNEVNIKLKVYKMLMKIGVSGGTIDDWQEATYDHSRPKQAMSPVYVGGLSKELVFQEVISNSAATSEETGTQPLGTLAGRGRMSGKHKGGKITVRADETSYVMGIVSLTPRLDYSQGNDWDMNIRNINDFHKPDLDQIGFQDSLNDERAWWTTEIDLAVEANNVYTSAGKVPAWLDYMTEYNKVKGNFANDEQGFMVQTRRYENNILAEVPEIKDLTTYIDPSKHNYIFADTRRDAQNFWVNIGMQITARRVMSAKVMPN